MIEKRVDTFADKIILGSSGEIARIVSWILHLRNIRKADGKRLCSYFFNETTATWSTDRIRYLVVPGIGTDLKSAIKADKPSTDAFLNGTKNKCKAIQQRKGTIRNKPHDKTIVVPSKTWCKSGGRWASNGEMESPRDTNDVTVTRQVLPCRP